MKTKFEENEGGEIVLAVTTENAAEQEQMLTFASCFRAVRGVGADDHTWRITGQVPQS